MVDSNSSLRHTGKINDSHVRERESLWEVNASKMKLMVDYICAVIEPWTKNVAWSSLLLSCKLLC